jgi:HSP20 family protein
MVNLVPRSFFSPRFPGFWDNDDDDFFGTISAPSNSGLSVSEDEKNVYIEAAVPGIDPDKVEVTYDKGALWIRGNQENEEKDEKRKYYRKASSAFSYRVAVPGNIEEKSEPQATCKNGVMKVSFAKIPETQPKKITVKRE